MSNPYRVEYQKKGKPTWVPTDPETGRPGHWIPSYQRVFVYNLGTCVVFPEDRTTRKEAINSALDRAIAYLQELKQS